MSDRRKAARFVLAKPASARLRVLQDVIVERSGPERLTLLAASASPKGEELAVRLRAEDGRAVTLAVRTLQSRAVMTEGSGPKYRLDLQVIDAVRSAEPLLET
jgi:hypothetical protein